ncbi:hypothetical protein MTR_5g078340 [Medicago truncatula]|uniref:Uncharacterized protein n=1 Tax=Medicago truncatula TaxID=3880 RepID=G7K1Q4_MEDTR|nr:hypothetical protein MTR_5g078340 [Medicago truncatula]
MKSGNSRTFLKKKKNRLRSSADQTNDFGVVNVADPEAWLHRGMESCKLIKDLKTISSTQHMNKGRLKLIRDQIIMIAKPMNKIVLYKVLVKHSRGS